ncbi:hypothetical protein ACMU_13660 [Actibacterium mucosum KCTC 23349]|uniref:DUF2946 domain-containing protein n=1 Tax=Actibacterium mucosum KCTC 23349 TaxID=1454373 RepID=A0A037ZHX7_9RHOB|nr:hypothetical protein [Actibacterium mucosum]KAJ55728.1 hypothetical protein ACMU_13660 [Actibacterium mucosum KCTC 23349]
MRDKHHQIAMIAKGLFLALFVVAVSLAGGTHRISLTQQDPEIAAYVAAGGSIHDLCLGLDSDEAAIASGCPFCILAAGAVLPAITHSAPLAVAPATRLRRPLARRTQSGAPRHIRPPVRAPPLA